MLAEIFDQAGLDYTAHNVAGGPWDTIRGIILHHQVGFDEDGFDSALHFVLTGPIAPYYNVWFNYGDGHRHIISEDEANHAGWSDPAHRQRIADGVRVDARPDLPRSSIKAGAGAVGFNDEFYGLSFEGPDADGNQSAAQYTAAVETCVAICEAHGWDPQVVIMGHLESAAPRGRKADPSAFPMQQFRDDVERAMALTPEQEATVDFMTEVLAVLAKDPGNSRPSRVNGFGLDTAQKVGASIGYADFWRNESAGQANVGGDRGDLIAEAYSLDGHSHAEFDLIIANAESITALDTALREHGHEATIVLR